MIDPLRELGGRKTAPAIAALPVCAVPLGAALRLFISLCPHLSPQPRCSSDPILCCGFLRAVGALPVPLCVLLPTHTVRVLALLSSNETSLQGYLKAMHFSDQVFLEACEAEALLHIAGAGRDDPADGTWHCTKQGSAFAL